MTTFKRICIKDYVIADKIGQTMSVERGKEYLTSSEEDGKVMVFGPFWVWFPADLFAGEQQFT